MVRKVYEISKIVYQCTGDLTWLSKNRGQGVIYTKWSLLQTVIVKYVYI